MTAHARKMEKAADDLEAAVRGEISELFLLVKSGRLSDEERINLKTKIDALIMQLETQYGGYNLKERREQR